MTSTLRSEIDDFCRWAGFLSWRVDPDGELTMVGEGDEPFGASEYISGSEIKTRWKALQAKVLSQEKK